MHDETVQFIIGVILALIITRIYVWATQAAAEPDQATNPQAGTQGGREAPLLMLSPNDPLTMHQCMEGCLAIGGTGSGKSSTMAHLMFALMQRGAGFLLLTAKSSDIDEVSRVAKEARRESDLVRFAPGEPHLFDFLDYELRTSPPGSAVANASQLLQDLVDFATRTSSAQANDAFWTLSASRLLRMALTLVWKTQGKCSVADLYRCITSLATTADQKQSPEWIAGFCCQCLLEIKKRPELERDSDLYLAVDYVMNEFPRLGEKTSMGVTATAMNAVEKFMSGDIRELVASGKTTISPEDVLQGKIVVADLPALKFREPGQFAQLVWKLSMIRAALRRDLRKNARPVVIWADEAQLHAVPSVDSMTQAVARSHRLINVAITQNMNLLESVMDSKEEARAWTSNLQTKFLFANQDHDTNEYFSDMLGQERQFLLSGNTGGGKPYDLVEDWSGRSQSTGAGFNEHYLPQVRPEDFLLLRKGGKENALLVDCYITQGGRKFSNSRTWIKATFRQRI